MHAECEAIVLPPMVQPIHLENRTNSETNQKVRHPYLTVAYHNTTVSSVQNQRQNLQASLFTTEL